MFQHLYPPDHSRNRGIERMAVIKHTENDAFAGAAVYRLRRDALMIVSNLNRGHKVSNQEAKRQLVFVQAQLCKAAIADPNLPDQDKSALVRFHAETISENLEDRRGIRRRQDSRIVAAAA